MVDGPDDPRLRVDLEVPLSDKIAAEFKAISGVSAYSLPGSEEIEEQQRQRTEDAKLHSARRLGHLLVRAEYGVARL